MHACLGSNLAKVYVFTMDKVLHCSRVIANTQRSCFSASQRPCHCGGCSIDLFVMNIEFITWPGKIYNFKWPVMDYPQCKWPKPGIKPN
jgi:hypothetical protein